LICKGFISLATFHQVKFWRESIGFKDDVSEMVERMHVEKSL
jgi:hypothetical protein